jgi:hypothetical protein
MTPVAADCAAWTTAAWNANHSGNIGLGFYGPGAVDAYILENVVGLSDWNSAVGHRRWLLYPPATNFATGDTPGSYDCATNAYWTSSNIIELDRKLIPGAAASLNFKFRRGYLTPGSSLAIESSSDGGVTWIRLGALITGNPNGIPDAAVGTDARALTATSVPVRVRFRPSSMAPARVCILRKSIPPTLWACSSTTSPPPTASGWS